ncbi:MAG: hypothetical protein IJV36_00355 [Prevotella sp.]|nr:hypothetical protein [Prevotella sp.]
METQLKQMIAEELKKLYCSILLSEVKDRVSKLKAYGVKDADIEAVLIDKVLLPQLVIKEDYKVVVVGKGEEKEVMMEPLVKAVYLLFLLHPEGIVLKCLPDYRTELTSIYSLLRPAGITERVRKSIMDVTNPTNNSINEKCARIRKIFSDILPKNVAKYYAISGKRGETKKIDLVRANVIWKCKLPSSQGLR